MFGVSAAPSRRFSSHPANQGIFCAFGFITRFLQRHEHYFAYRVYVHHIEAAMSMHSLVVRIIHEFVVQRGACA
jgi:hypothetical protein